MSDRCLESIFIPIPRIEPRDSFFFGVTLERLIDESGCGAMGARFF